MDTIKDFIRQLPRPQRRLLAYHRQLVPDVAVWREFRSKRRILIASDGGLKGRFDTFGWTISSKGIVLFEGAGPVDGPFDLLHSTWCELGGFAAPLLLLATIGDFWGLQHRCR